MIGGASVVRGGTSLGGRRRWYEEASEVVVRGGRVEPVLAGRHIYIHTYIYIYIERERERERETE